MREKPACSWCQEELREEKVRVVDYKEFHDTKEKPCAELYVRFCRLIKYLNDLACFGGSHV